MLKHCSALLAVTLAAAFVSPSFSQAPSRTKVGMLGCTLSPSIGFIIGSQQSMACQFTPDGPFPPEGYLGVIDTVGLDIGFTAGGALAWAVFAPTEGPPRGGLAGKYLGASGDVGFGVGVGANVLLGGSSRTVALQPLSLEGQVGVNLAVGLSSLELRPAP